MALLRVPDWDAYGQEIVEARKPVVATRVEEKKVCSGGGGYVPVRRPTEGVAVEQAPGALGSAEALVVVAEGTIDAFTPRLESRPDDKIPNIIGVVQQGIELIEGTDEAAQALADAQADVELAEAEGDEEAADDARRERGRHGVFVFLGVTSIVSAGRGLSQLARPRVPAGGVGGRGGGRGGGGGKRKKSRGEATEQTEGGATGAVYQVRVDPKVPGRPDPRYSVDTNTFVNPKGRNAAGFPRDSAQFWSAWKDLQPGSLSKNNRFLIDELGLSPRVDDIWIRAFPEHAPFKGQTLVHHHVNEARYAIPVPAGAHRGSGGPFHGFSLE